jgi:hypothetical protein
VITKGLSHCWETASCVEDSIITYFGPLSEEIKVPIAGVNIPPLMKS